MKSQQLLHVPLEPYQSRYTADLRVWEDTAFSKQFSVTPILPTDTTTATGLITTGEVLDARARPLWALSQMQTLLRQGPFVGKTYFSDFFMPGLEALSYSRADFKAAAYCWAQTFDEHDFTRRLFVNWMRPWEIMAFEIYSRVYVACDELRDLIVTALPHVADKIKVVGLPYNHQQIFGQLRQLPSTRNFDVVYAARWDVEKQPSQFLAMVNEGQFKAVVCTGHPTLQGTDQQAIGQAYEMAAAGNLTILTNLTRADYFYTLACSNVLFNCGLQDWVSFTLLDGLTFGCMPMYPAHRSFPAALLYCEDFLYPPGDIETACHKISRLITERPRVFMHLASSVLAQHDAALSLIAEDLLAL